MSHDARLFAYALEPQLQRLRWRLDESLAALATAVRELDRRRAECHALDDEIAAAVRLPVTVSPRIDVVLARNALAYAAALRQRLALADEARASAEADEQTRREYVAAIRVEIDKLERDREERLAEHARERQRLAAREADQDWTARAHWRSATRAGTAS